MVNGDDEVEVNSLINKRCDEIAMKDIENGIIEKTANRRKIVNRHVETLHLLNDILSMKGVIFNSKMTTGNHGVVKETIHSLQFGDWGLNKDQISLFGRQLNVFLSDLIQQEKGMVTLKKDENILLNYFTSLILKEILPILSLPRQTALTTSPRVRTSSTRSILSLETLEM
jgi:hypothetical protein